MKIYKAKKNGLIHCLLAGALIFPLVIFALGKDVFCKIPHFVTLLLLSPSIIPFSLLVWLYFGTFYQIENGELSYKSAFIKGKIAIGTIKKVTSGVTLLVGVKPALANNGLIILYNQFDEMYIAPESNNEVINDLLAINKNIVVVNEKSK